MSECNAGGLPITTVGYVLVYIDDILISAESHMINQVHAALAERFQLAAPQQASYDQPVQFCGYEILKCHEGFLVGQGKYVKDLLERRGIVSGESCPCPKVEDDEDEPNPRPSDIKLAQALTGELMWVASRS